MTPVPFQNRLIHQKSPYLLQHAANPVDWFPWGQEAFEKAEKENKPIFLSIGYSTCHWCHVMEHESFENSETAQLLNAHFVSIKLDREERPDIDHVYMSYIQATTGGGGWPMSVWLTPERKPFFGGTYFPPEDRYGRPGFNSILKKIAESWKNDEASMRSVAERATAQLIKFSNQLGESHRVELHSDVLSRAAASLMTQYDDEWGGYGNAPKFPRPSVLNFMLMYAHDTADKNVLNSVLYTLKKMADGGMHDLIAVKGKGGGGFARYSTDRFWHVPHFEKMLYDNAQLAVPYLDAFLITNDRFFAEVAEDIFNYVLCDMTDAATGGFYSAEDADSLPSPEATHKTEGGFYVWELAEIDELLGEELSAIFCYLYGVKPTGNAPSDPHNEFVLKNILIRRVSDDEAAAHFSLPLHTLKEKIEQAKGILYDARLRRPRPHRDDKILTSWNGLMITALCKGYAVLKTPAYLKAALKAADFILNTLTDQSQGTLLRRYRDGEAAIAGTADDYANFIDALISLYEVTFEARYLKAAITIGETFLERFFDEDNGGFFTSDAEAEDVLIHQKEDHDGAEPSPNSIAVKVFLKLAAMTDRDDFRSAAEKTISFFSQLISRAPSYVPQLLVGLSFTLQKPKQIILTGKKASPAFEAMHSAAFDSYRQQRVMLFAEADTAELLPFLSTLLRESESSDAKAFVCIDYACQLPTEEIDQFRKLIQ